MNEKLSLLHRIRNKNGSGVLVLEGETDGRPFVRIDTELGGARYCVRVSPEQAVEMGLVLSKLAVQDGPEAEGLS